MERHTSQIREIFSARLRTIRKEAGYKSARALAQVLDIDENRYTRYERAEVEPNLQLIMQICSKLGTSPNALFGYDDYSAHDNAAYAAPGFGEPGSQAAFGVSSAAELAKTEVLTADAAYWRVAELVADMSVTGQSHGIGELQRISTASQVFTRIKADPFTYATEIVGDARVKQASRAMQDELADRLKVAIQLTVGRVA